ncbi:MAG: alpha/beta hydrolase [Pseudomonadota bacterium]
MTDKRSNDISMGEDRLAVEITEGATPDILWLGGFRSDMTGGKATALADWGAARGRKVVRFDYRGHGASTGAFENFVISDWLADARAVHTAHCAPGTIAVGSSMGGWIALLMATALHRAGTPLGGLVLIAPAADFTERLMWPNLPDPVKDALQSTGFADLPSDFGTPTRLTIRLFEDGKNHLLYGREPIAVGCPVHILQGVLDDAVPHAHAMALVERLAHDDVVFTLIKDGDHRLSREADIERLIAAVAGLPRTPGAPPA